MVAGSIPAGPTKVVSLEPRAAKKPRSSGFPRQEAFGALQRIPVDTGEELAYARLLVFSQVDRAILTLLPCRDPFLGQPVVQISAQELRRWLGQRGTDDAVRHHVELVEDELAEPSSLAFLAIR